jgi:hypothetical protein
MYAKSCIYNSSCFSDNLTLHILIDDSNVKNLKKKYKSFTERKEEKRENKFGVLPTIYLKLQGGSTFQNSHRVYHKNCALNHLQVRMNS